MEISEKILEISYRIGEKLPLLIIVMTLITIVSSIVFIAVILITQKTIQKQIISLSDILNLSFSGLWRYFPIGCQVFLFSLPWIFLLGIGVLIPIYLY